MRSDKVQPLRLSLRKNLVFAKNNLEQASDTS